MRKLRLKEATQWPRVTQARKPGGLTAGKKKDPLQLWSVPQPGLCECQCLLENLLKMKILGPRPGGAAAVYWSCILMSSPSGTVAGCLMLGAFKKDQSLDSPHTSCLSRGKSEKAGRLPREGVGAPAWARAWGAGGATPLSSTPSPQPHPAERILLLGRLSLSRGFESHCGVGTESSRWGCGHHLGHHAHGCHPCCPSLLGDSSLTPGSSLHSSSQSHSLSFLWRQEVSTLRGAGGIAECQQPM